MAVRRPTPAELPAAAPPAATNQPAVSPLPTVGSVDEALQLVLANMGRLPAEIVSLADSGGRVLAEDIAAPADLWPAPRSAMDGYAVRSSDIAGASPDHPTVLAVDEAASTEEPGLPLRTAHRVATGSPVPAGADVVIPFEQTRREGGALVVTAPLSAGAHIFPAGEDARRGEVILQAGEALRGGHLGLLAGLGVTVLPVVRRPRVAILAVGDELVEADAAPAPGQVRESNSYALAAEVRALGGEVDRLGIARDQLGDLIERIRAGLRADVLLVCGGMSVGEDDVVKNALVQAGVRLVFWCVPMKPGKPVAFGLGGEARVFGLPGPPAAAMVAFEELVRPALRALMGLREIHAAWLPATLLAPIVVRPGRRRYHWARAVASGDGLTVQPLRAQGIATLRSISDANALIRIEPEIATLAAGDRVLIRLLADAHRAGQPAGGIPLIAVTGAKHAGKTLLIERLLPEFRRRGYRVGVVKHDAHGFAMDREGTDTRRASQAGAEAVAIAGPEAMAVILRTADAPLEVILAHMRDVDLILVEGYSREPIPHVEVRRSGVPVDKPPPAGRCLAVVSDAGRDGAFTFEQIPAVADLIERELRLVPQRPATDHERR